MATVVHDRAVEGMILLLEPWEVPVASLYVSMLQLKGRVGSAPIVELRIAVRLFLALDVVFVRLTVLHVS